MKISIITAMPEETGALLKRFEATKKDTCGSRPFYHFKQNIHEIVLCEAGMGFDNAARAAEAVIREFRPDLMVSCGFCGGIAPGLKVGDVVVARDIMIASGATAEQVPVKIPAVCASFVEQQGHAKARVFNSLFVSTQTIMPKMRLAALLPPEAYYPVVEMESAAIAIIAVENGVRFAGIRSVSDPFDEELGFSLNEFCDNQMRIRIPRVLFTILQKPRIIPQLIRLARNSRIAGNSLAGAMEQFLAVV